MLEWSLHGEVAVGVTTLRAGFSPTAVTHLSYGASCVVGLLAWWRVERAHRLASTPERTAEGAPA